MISKKEKAASTVAASVLAAAAFTLTVPGTSFAINEVKCDPNENFVKIWSHPSNGSQSVNCYANAGMQSFDGWFIDKVETGNNTFVYHDNNGDVVQIDKGKTQSFPNRPPKVDDIEIR